MKKTNEGLVRKCTSQWLLGGLALLAGVGTVTTASASPDDREGLTTLSTVTVKDTGTTDYVVRRTNAAAKLDTPLLETPMAVQSVSRQTLDDQRAATTLEAIQYLSGVQSQPGSFYEQFQIRGFGSGYGVSYRNGLQLEGIADSVNMSFVDRIEVIKGPASMLYGRVEPGGFVNVVTKRPEAERYTSIEQRVGSWGNYHTTFDTTGALNADGSVAFRLIGDYDKGDNFFRFDHHDKKAVMGSIAMKISPKFSMNVDVEIYDYKSAGRGPNTALPIVGDRPDGSLPMSASSSNPALWDRFPDLVRRNLLGVDWTYALNDQWKITQRFHYVFVDEVQTGLSDWGGFYGFIYNPLKREIYNTNIDLVGEFSTGDIKHKVVLGVDAYRYHDDWKGLVGLTTIPAPGIYSSVVPDIGGQLEALKRASLNNVLWNTLEAGTGAYFQDLMTLNEKWLVLLGGRWDRATQEYSSIYGANWAPCYPNCTGLPKGNWPSDDRFSPRAAVLYKLDEATSIYASYSKSFGMNNSSYLASGSSAEPEIGEQYELGFKQSILNDRAMVSATLFDLTKSNILQTNPASPFGPQIPIGKVRSHGLELDIAGQVTEHVNIVGSYTYNPVKITRDTNTPSNEGNTVSGTPTQSASLWTKYDVSPGAIEGWSFGVGLNLKGLRQGDNANTWQMPGYGTVDVMASYRTLIGGQKVTAQLNIKNLFDRKYFDQIGWGTASYGAPQSAVASVKVDF